MTISALILFSIFALRSVHPTGIRMQRDFHYPIWKTFPVYWNVPSFMCKSRGFDFESSLKRWGIKANPNDDFRGEVINILYDPGLFPAMLRTATGKMLERNGGIPQLGSITKHLEAFRKVVEQLVPHDFSGIGVIDFEAWRPVFRQNWNDQAIYLNMSKELERQKHPQWDENTIAVAAKKHFNDSAKTFLKSTLNLAQILRPKAVWGYYGYPFCYNYRQNNGFVPWCHRDVEVENNRIQWLFDESTAIYPSIYLTKSLNIQQQRQFVIGRLNEAWRLASRVSTHKIPPIHPYLWYKFYDAAEFIPQDILENIIGTTMKYKMGGLVIWGATNDVRTGEKCNKLKSYLDHVLGPTLEKLRHPTVRQEILLNSLDYPIVNLSNPTTNATYRYETTLKPRNQKRSNDPSLLTKFMTWYDGVIKALLNVN